MRQPLLILSAVCIVSCSPGPRDPNELLKDAKFRIERDRIEQQYTPQLLQAQAVIETEMKRHAFVHDVAITLRFLHQESMGHRRTWFAFSLVALIKPDQHPTDEVMKSTIREAFERAGYAEAAFSSRGVVDNEWYSTGSAILDPDRSKTPSPSTAPAR